MLKHDSIFQEKQVIKLKTFTQKCIITVNYSQKWQFTVTLNYLPHWFSKLSQQYPEFNLCVGFDHPVTYIYFIIKLLLVQIRPFNCKLYMKIKCYLCICILKSSWILLSLTLIFISCFQIWTFPIWRIKYNQEENTPENVIFYISM